MPDVIKIDVEGAEQEVIEGAIKTITKFQPVVLFEHGAGAAEYYGSGSDEIHDLLCADAGLRIFDNDGNGPFSREEFEDLFDTPVWNSFARR